jgi:hypothetical protein
MCCTPQDVLRLGQKGEVRDASAGWVRHDLFPQGKVLYATPENVEAHAMVCASAAANSCQLHIGTHIEPGLLPGWADAQHSHQWSIGQHINSSCI